MPYNNHRVSSQLGNTRTVQYNGGGLNERFSKIINSQKQSNTNTPRQVSGPQSSSVFSRLRGNVQPTKSSNKLQNRLGKTVGGGIKKKPAVVKTKQVGKRVVSSKKPTIEKKGKKDQKKDQKKVTKKVTKKPASADDLDRDLDSYMMKDPKTAQAKLDAEMNAYMAEAELMEE